jgi:hypothetical protein
MIKVSGEIAAQYHRRHNPAIDFCTYTRLALRNVHLVSGTNRSVVEPH